MKNTTTPSKYKNPKKKRTGLKIFLIILLIVAVMVCVALSPLFNVKSINVSGTERLSKEQVIASCGITVGKNCFLYNCFSIKKKIEKLPVVLNAKVKRVFPSDFSIEITERQSMAYIPFIGSNIFIDETGKIIEVLGAENQLENSICVIGITPTKFQLGEYLETNSNEAVDVLKKCIQAIKTSGLVGKVSNIDITDFKNITLTANENKVIVGTADELDYKFEFLAQILINLRSDEHGTIDLTTAPNVLFRPNLQ